MQLHGSHVTVVVTPLLTWLHTGLFAVHQPATPGQAGCACLSEDLSFQLMCDETHEAKVLP